MAEPWTFIVYRAPKQPSSARVAAWRGLHRVGAVYIGQSACALPARVGGEELERIRTHLIDAGGSWDAYSIAELAPESEERLVGLYNAARDAEYDELIERAEAVISELEREGAKEKFTFAEVEENEADVTRLRRWLNRIRWRDVFGAPRREAADAAVRVAQDRLEAFTNTAIERDSGSPDVDGNGNEADDSRR